VAYSPKDAYIKAKQAVDILAREFNVSMLVRPAEKEGSYPGRFAFLELDGKKIGGLGEFHPQVLISRKIKGSVGFMEIDIKTLFAAAKPKHYQEISKFPAIRRDISVLVSSEVMWQDMAAALTEHNIESEFMDDYRGADIPRGLKAVTIRLTFVSTEGTLTDAEADASEREVMALLQQKFGAKPRG
jgi:phenylalanyl-tRNA synthetase beta chain